MEFREVYWRLKNALKLLPQEFKLWRRILLSFEAFLPASSLRASNVIIAI